MSEERNPSAQEIQYLLTLLKEELGKFQRSRKKTKLVEALNELDKYEHIRLWSCMYEEHVVAIEALEAWVSCWQEEHERNL